MVRKRFALFMAFWSLLLLSVAAQGNISMTFSNESLPSAFSRLSKASGYKIMFTYNDVENYRVNGTVKQVSFTQALEYVLRGKPLAFAVKGNIARIYPGKPITGQNRIITIHGKVVDKENGEPIIGASVKVAGYRLGTVTQPDGTFVLQGCPDNATIIVSYLGMSTYQAQAEENMKDIALSAQGKDINEVVVTGIFQKAKESYTGAVTSIDSEKLQSFKGSNLLQTLKNIDASINFPINNVAGSNPNVLPNLNIRGSSSLPMSVEEFNSNAQQTVNTPLIILDGFEISLTKLMDYNDEQIQSINILKDAAATAIYGSRGANGVIVVVTKTPKEGRLRVTAKAGIDLQLPDLSSYNMLNATEKLRLENEIGLYTAKNEPPKQYNYTNVYNARLKKVLDGTDIDWLHIPVRNGVGQRYNLQLDGGSHEFKWAASLGYNDVEGAMKGSSRKTVNGDITLMYSVKNLIFRNYTSFTSNHSENSKYGSFQDYVDQQPYNNPYDKNGEVVKSFDNFYMTDKVGNPLYDATLNTFDKSEYASFINNFSVEWIIMEGLRLRGKLGYSTTRSTSDVFLPAEHSTFSSKTYNTAEGILRKGRYTYGNGFDDYYNADLTLSYNKTFADKHQFYVGLNYAISQENIKDYTFVAEGFTNEDMSFLGNATQYEYGGAPSGDKSTVRLVGFTGNANYTYDNRYYVDLSYRVDGSSKYGSEKRFAPFWSTGIGWNMHNEKWLRGNNIVNTLRLRASYGVTGSQNFTTENVYTSYQYIPGSRYMNWTAASLMGLGNPNLTWQKTKETNLGFEVGLLRNRVTLEFDYYNKKTTDLLSSMDLPLSTGFSSYVANIGEMSNKGFEMSLNAYIIRNHNKRFNWMVGGQLVHDVNKITRLSDAIMEQNQKYLSQNVDVANLFYVGKPLNAIYAVRSNGIDPSTGKEVFLDKDGQVTDTWAASDKVYLGSSQPTYRGNARTMVMWKDLTLNVSFGFHWGGKTYNSTLRDRVEVDVFDVMDRNVDVRALNERWLKPGDNTFFQGYNEMNTHATSRFVFDDKVLTLQTVSLQYRLNNNWLHTKTGLESVLFGVNLNDLFYWSSVKYERGTSYPYARNMQASVTLTF